MAEKRGGPPKLPGSIEVALDTEAEAAWEELVAFVQQNPETALHFLLSRNFTLLPAKVVALVEAKEAIVMAIQNSLQAILPSHPKVAREIVQLYDETTTSQASQQTLDHRLRSFPNADWAGLPGLLEAARAVVANDKTEPQDDGGIIDL